VPDGIVQPDGRGQGDGARVAGIDGATGRARGNPALDRGGSRQFLGRGIIQLHVADDRAGGRIAHGVGGQVVAVDAEVRAEYVFALGFTCLIDAAQVPVAEGQIQLEAGAVGLGVDGLAILPVVAAL